MKKKITTLALLAVIITTSIFAADKTNITNSEILSAFASKFTTATEVSWEKGQEFVKASFKLNEQYMFAYYTEGGELLGVCRNIHSNQLPLNLQVELKKISANGWITDLFEYASDSDNAYYVTIENADQQIQLKSTGYNSWTVYKKVKKS
jgi:hypothetical protein